MDSNRSYSYGLLAGAVCAYGLYRIATAAMRRYDFRGRTVVITGGSRGLGLVMARQLADEGARIAICSRHDNELEHAARELRERGATVVSATCDVTKSPEVHEFFDRVRDQLGPIDVLINSAGIIQIGPLETMTEEDFEQAMAVHFTAPLIAMQQVVPEMRRRGQGRIVNIASIGGQLAVPHLLPYCASKFALVGLSEGYRAELVKDGVYVTTVCPGLMRTGSYRRGWFKGQHRMEYTWFSHSASAPLITISAERAARHILRACRYGRARVTLSLPAKAAAWLDALAPEVTADIASVVARFLPQPGGIGTRMVEGQSSSSRWSPSIATILGERAAIRNNEMSTGLSGQVR